MIGALQQKLLLLKNTMDKCYLVERGKMYEVIINGKSVGKGQADNISTAYYFYKSEGMDVEIIPE